eukprot:487141_1
MDVVHSTDDGSWQLTVIEKAQPGKQRRKIYLKVKSGDSFNVVKSKIQEKVDIPPADQHLLFRNKLLNYERTLADYKMDESSIIQLFHMVSRAG